MITFRSASVTDIPLIRELARRVWSASYREMLPPEQIEYMLGWMYSEDALQRDLGEGVIYEVIALAGEPIGYLALGPNGEREWKLHKLYLLPGHQGRGFGGEALEHACQLAASHGAHQLSLNVNKQNARAIRAYERAGFRRTGAVVNGIGGGFVMDDFVFARELSPGPAGS
jgi:diamine N-acetyltransferase